MFDYKRSHACGELTKKDIGKSITLSGWVNKTRDHGGLIFVDLRDKFGLTQIVFDPSICSDLMQKAADLRGEWVISIKGNVSARGEGLANPKLKTGEIEIKASELEILSSAKTPPFSIIEKTDVNEELRLKYRYLDLRRGPLLKKLELRHRTLFATREFFFKNQFIEVETPILSKTTPEGARDYLVPSRIYPGNFYALPQSPQLYKQLMMISGLDRYFQIAKCFRDEDLRADRQPEFTQIDVEMSFATVDDLYSLIEQFMKGLLKTILNVDLKTPFKRLSHRDALEKYGSDKPDLRFGMEFSRLDEILKEAQEYSPLKETVSEKEKGAVKGFLVKGGTNISRKNLANINADLRKSGVKGLFYLKKQENQLTSGCAKFFSVKELEKIEQLFQTENGDLILISAGQENLLNQALDQLRRQIAKERNLIDPDQFNFLWVTDFPMFTLNKETQEITSEHHPFTSPMLEDVPLLEKEPLKVRSLAYDLVLNGYELASGSQRIHNSALQEKIFKLLKLSPADIKNKFGYFVEALSYGTPPHLGCAIGLDRLIMIMTKTDNIRDVIAFPKTQKASDLMSQSPSIPENKQLKELKIKAEDHEEIIWN